MSSLKSSLDEERNKSADMTNKLDKVGSDYEQIVGERDALRDQLQDRDSVQAQLRVQLDQVILV